MIEAVTAVARADAVAVAVAAGAGARPTLEGRQRRLRWLGALHAANGEAPVLDDEERDETILADNRRRIRAALDTIDELDGLDAHDEEPAEENAKEDADDVSAGTIARLMLARRDASVGAQAHLGAISVRHLLG